MSEKKRLTRRNFLKNGAIVSAAFALGNAAGIPARITSRNPSDVIGVGIIGPGSRGLGLIREALNTPKIEFRGVCDIWDVRLKAGLESCGNQKAATYADYRGLLENPDIDSVIIGAPDHWHMRMAIDAAEAGKDIYSEKCMAHTIDEGKAIRKSIRDNERVYQLGHQLRSRKSSFQAKEIIDSGALGKVTYVTLNHSRNKPVGRKRGWFVPGPEDFPTDLTPERLDWNRFLGSAPKHPWAPERYLAWRCFWDYGTGLAGDMQSHVIDLTNQLLGMGIPEKAYSSGQITYWKDGREVPDIWHSVLEWPSRDLIIVYTCNFTNEREGSMCRFFGTEGTMEFYSDIKVFAEPLSHLYIDFFERIKAGRIPRARTHPGDAPPVYEYQEDDRLAVADHMQDFFDCIRTRGKTRCNEDVAFQEMATTAMSVASYRLNKAVGWDSAREEIV